MSKMIIMRGLPASGKSTRAEELSKEMGNAVRINKDLLRTMLHFDKFTFINEERTRNAARVVAKKMIEEGACVIIDDTNLNEKTMQSWKDLGREFGCKVEVVDMDTPLEECIERDKKREKKVGEHVIYQMALQNGMVPESTFVICDIDGTLAETTHRLHYLYADVGKLVPHEKKDWGGFFKAAGDDRFRAEVWEQVAAENSDVILVSARPEEYRAQTQEWLAKHGLHEGWDYKTLIMRKSGDRRDDDIVKAEVADRYFKGHTIKRVYDDRPRIIRMWRERGYDVVDVGPGTEF